MALMTHSPRRIRTEKEGGAWCPAAQISPDSSEWLEVDLGRPFLITAVETQGRYGGGHGREVSRCPSG